jgi:hypothetical protein
MFAMSMVGRIRVPPSSGKRSSGKKVHSGQRAKNAHRNRVAFSIPILIARAACKFKGGKHAGADDEWYDSEPLKLKSLC